MAYIMELRRRDIGGREELLLLLGLGRRGGEEKAGGGRGVEFYEGGWEEGMK
jgi:hypothetical protein